MAGYGETPWYMQGDFGGPTPPFKEEHEWTTRALDAWPDPVLFDETPVVVTVLLHKDLLDYAHDENGKIIGVRASEKLRKLAEEQSSKQ